jgi:hypothetical protein
MTENGVPKWRHTRSVGQSVAGRTPGWSGPSCVNNKQASYRYTQLTTIDITAEYMEHPKILIMIAQGRTYKGLVLSLRLLVNEGPCKRPCSVVCSQFCALQRPADESRLIENIDEVTPLFRCTAGLQLRAARRKSTTHRNWGNGMVGATQQRQSPSSYFASTGLPNGSMLQQGVPSDIGLQSNEQRGMEGFREYLENISSA